MTNPTHHHITTRPSHTDTVGLTREQVDYIAELLEITDTFLRTRQHRLDPLLDAHLLHHGISAGPCWFTQAIGQTALQLRIAASHPELSTPAAIGDGRAR